MLKLYDSFTKIVNEIQPELVWMTSFNLDIELVEKYLIAVLANKEPAELRTVEDYEVLNNYLQQENVSIKVWYDYRASHFNKGKRTTVDTIAVNPRDLNNLASKQTIFHPKVIFLKGKLKAYLIVGSANLSFAAWSSNKEGVLIKEITTQQNADEVISFFKGINADVKFTKLDKWKNSLLTEESNWRFTHNYNVKNSFIDFLSGDELSIWSPYFSKDTFGLLQKIKDTIQEANGSVVNKINIIPDRNEAGNVRIEKENLNTLLADKAINFYFDKDNQLNETNRFNHAKVWLTNTQIALGSWNCTAQATAIGIPKYTNNIEAGIVETFDVSNVNILSQLNLLQINEANGSTQEELDSNWEGVLNNFTYTCQLFADWETFTYSFKGEPNEKYFIKLPHEPNVKQPLFSIEEASFFNHHERVLKNKEFTIVDAKDKVLFIGYIIEKNKQKRIAEGYINIIDIIDALAFDPHTSTGKTKAKYNFSEEDDSGSDKGVVFEYNGFASMYKMFVGFEKLQRAISNATDMQVLDKLIFRNPGSLANIVRLIDLSIQELKPKEVNNENIDEYLFHYFIADEANDIIVKLNKHKIKLATRINGLQEAISFFEKKLNLTARDKNFLKNSKTIIK